MRRRSARSLAATSATLLAVGLAGWVSPAARAESEPPVTATGWWTRQPLAQPIAEDGFAVAWTIEEQSAAAVRIDLSTPLEGTVYLELTEAATGSVAPDQGGIQACVATEGWEPANPGAYEDLPASDCGAATSVELGRDAAALTWLTDITALVAAAAGDELDLVLHPLPKPVSADVPASAPFTVQLSGAALLVDPATVPTTPEPPTTLPVDPGFVDPGIGGPSVGGGFDAPTAPPVDLPPNATTTTEAEDPGELVALGPVDVTGGESKPWVRLVLLTPISAGIGLAMAAARRYLEERALARGTA